MNKYGISLYAFQAFIHSAVCVFMAYKCFEHQLRFKRQTTIIGAGIYIGSSILVIELFLKKTAPLIEYSTGAGTVSAIIVVGFCLVFAKTHVLYLIFLIFFIMNVSLMSMYISNIIYNLNVFPMSNIYYALISTGVWLCIIPFIWYLILVLFKKLINLGILETYLRWFFVLPVAYYMFYMLMGKSFLRNISWTGLFAVLILNLVTYLAYVAVMIMFLKMNEVLVKKGKIQLFEQMIIVRNDQYTQGKENMEEIYRIKHDFRHNLIVIKNFVQNNDLQGLENYLEICDDYKLETGHIYNTNNSFVDIILNHYDNVAKSENVDIRISVKFPKGFEFPDNELVVLFGNLLENAIESCKRQNRETKFIEVQTKEISESMVAIKIINSYSDTIVKKGEGFVSSKGKGLGIGTSTIRFISEKNGGSCEFNYENGIFTACVLLITE